MQLLHFQILFPLLPRKGSARAESSKRTEKAIEKQKSKPKTKELKMQNENERKEEEKLNRNRHIHTSKMCYVHIYEEPHKHMSWIQTNTIVYWINKRKYPQLKTFANRFSLSVSLNLSHFSPFRNFAVFGFCVLYPKRY